MKAKTSINNLPPCIIESILCLVPIQDAVRTSILSKEWKYHWTKIPKLAFIEDKVQVSSNDHRVMGFCWFRTQHKVFNAINKVMSMHQGPIHEFSLSMYTRDGLDHVIDHIIDCLSRNNTVRKLTLDMHGTKLPQSLFSLHKLTDLYLNLCNLCVGPTSSGFGNLTNLCMEDLFTNTRSLIVFLSNCPLLKTVTVTLILYELGMHGMKNSTLIELFECLPVIENLSISLFTMEGIVPHKLPTALVHLRYLCIRNKCHKYRLPCLVFLIRSSPNLEKLKLENCDYQCLETDLEDYSDMWLEHLNELEIGIQRNIKFGMDFVKLILAKSPVLKKLRILMCMEVSKDEELQILEIFLQSRQASPAMEIIVKREVTE